MKQSPSAPHTANHSRANSYSASLGEPENKAPNDTVMTSVSVTKILDPIHVNTDALGHDETVHPGMKPVDWNRHVSCYHWLTVIIVEGVLEFLLPSIYMSA
jgi:hypothetical protein